MKKRIEGKGFLEVKRSEYVIFGKKRYLKTDRNNVVEVISRETRRGKHYHRSSPLITKTYNSQFSLTSECEYCEDLFGYVNVIGKPLKRFKDKWYLPKNIVKVNGIDHWIKDEKICLDYINRDYIFVKDRVPIHPSIYGSNKFTLHPDHNGKPLVKVSGSETWARESDTKRIKTLAGNVVFWSGDKGRRLAGCFVGFINPELKTFDNNIKTGYCETSNTGVGSNFIMHEETGRYVHNNDYPEYNKLWEEWYKDKNSKSVKAAILKANKHFSDKDSVENNPSFMRFGHEQYKPRWGGETGYDGRKGFIVSSTSAKTGGMQYTYGIEIETSDGFLSDSELKSTGLCVTGDNSITGNEYITQALHGDLGLEMLKNAFATVKERCVVDDSCSIHVHIGGYKHPKVWTPDFGIRFAVNSIKLGCQIEEDLFMTQPSSRSPWKKHCHCITSSNGNYSGDYRKISMDNYKKMLGSYVFGREISREMNSMATPSKWATPRYKWLNLRNAVTNTPIDTIELRIFAPTTDYWKAEQAIRISLAFVWFIENKQGRIKKGDVRLAEMLETAYSRHQGVLDDVMKYVTERSLKFKRTIY